MQKTAPVTDHPETLETGPEVALETELCRLLREAGLRVTSARKRVLGALLCVEQALTHGEFERRLATVRKGASAIDRVTLYRVLDDLVEQGLARRVAGSDRVWRFGPALEARGRAQFECNGCGAVVLLDHAGVGGAGGGEGVAPGLAVPQGFRFEQFEVTVRGRCARCA